MFKKVVLSFLSLSLVACSARSPSPNRGQDLQHTVSYKGENLGRISEWYTGSFSNWQSIAARNPHIAPQALKIGEKVYVPSVMVLKSDKMPKAFLDPSRKNAAVPDASKKPLRVAAVKVAKKRVAQKDKPVAIAKNEVTSPKVENSKTTPVPVPAKVAKPESEDTVVKFEAEEKKELAAIDAEVSSIESEGKAEPLNSVFVCRGTQCNKAKELPDTEPAETEVAEIAKIPQ